MTMNHPRSPRVALVPSVLGSGLRMLPLLLLASILLNACGTRQIRDLPPLVRLSQIELDGDQQGVWIRIENPNDIPFQAEQVDLALELGETGELFYMGAADVDIVPRSAEEVRLDLQLESAQQEALQALSGQAGLSWALEGKLPQLEGRDWPFRSRGVIYPVPGRPGLYRASATGSAYPIQRPR